MKICTVCKNVKERLAFNKNKTRKDGLNNICKECSRAKSKTYYKLHGQNHRLAVKKRSTSERTKLRQLMVDFLKDKKCKDCGIKDIRVLDFDHLRDKVAAVSQLMASVQSWARILQEIEKCDIVCSNCHRIRTATRANNYKHTSCNSIG